LSIMTFGVASPNIRASLIDIRGLLPNVHTVNEPTCIKSKGLPIDISFYAYTFYMRNAVYKK
jgi:hypothetical protein